MKTIKIKYTIPLLLLSGILIASNYTQSKKTYISVDKIFKNTTENKDNFTKIMDVLTHPRCMNCHPSDNIPKQGLDSHPHYFGMEGGKKIMVLKLLSVQLVIKKKIIIFLEFLELHIGV
jgi:hypothetical protein